MPNANTFSMPPVGDFVKRWTEGRTCIVDPFARDNPTGAQHSNDINPVMASDHHKDAREFLDDLIRADVGADCIIFDPPYSPTQIKRAYESAGLEVTQQDTQSARLKRECRDRFRLTLRRGAWSFPSAGTPWAWARAGPRAKSSWWTTAATTMPRCAWLRPATTNPGTNLASKMSFVRKNHG